MDESQGKFIKAATQDLEGNHEQYLAAEQMLQAQLQPCEPEVLQRATTSLQRDQTQAKWMRRGLYMAAILLSAPLILMHGHKLFKTSNLYRSVSSYSGGDPTEEVITQQLSSEEELIIFGDRQFLNESDRKKALWDSEPENPAYYSEYAMAYNRDHSGLPIDFVKHAEQLDPGNGWYRLISASIESEGAVKKVKIPNVSGGKSRGWKMRGEEPPSVVNQKNRQKRNDLRPEWTVLDEEKMQRVLLDFYAAAEMPRFTSYEKQMLVARTKILPEATDFVSMVSLIAYMAGQPLSKFQLLHLSNVVAAEAYRCEIEKDQESLRKLILAWGSVARALNQDSVYLVDALITKAWMSKAVLNLRDAAGACGLPEDQQDFADIHLEFEALKTQRSKRKSEELEEQMFRRKAGMLHQMAFIQMSRHIKNPPVLVEADLEPGRQVDHGLVGRVMAVGAWNLLLLLMFGIWLSRFRAGPVARIVSGRLTSLFHVTDWAYLFIGGVIFPWVYYWVIQLWSPLSAREEGIMFTVCMQAGGQFVGMILMMLSWSLLIVRWRLVKKGGVLGGVARQKMAAMAIVSAIVIPLFGVVTWSIEYKEVWLYAAGGVCGIVEIWLLVVVCRALFGNANDALGRITVSRLLLPAYALMIVLMAASVAINQQQEKYWVQKDWFFDLSVEEPGFSRVEYRMASQLQKELAELMDTHRVGR